MTTDRQSPENDAACRCDCAHVGAQMVGTPTRCERCRGLVDEVAAQRMDAAYAEARRELEEWAKANPITSVIPPEVAR